MSSNYLSLISNNSNSAPLEDQKIEWYEICKNNDLKLFNIDKNQSIGKFIETQISMLNPFFSFFSCYLKRYTKRRVLVTLVLHVNLYECFMEVISSVGKYAKKYLDAKRAIKNMQRCIWEAHYVFFFSINKWLFCFEVNIVKIFFEKYYCSVTAILLYFCQKMKTSSCQRKLLTNWHVKVFVWYLIRSHLNMMSSSLQLPNPHTNAIQDKGSE